MLNWVSKRTFTLAPLVPFTISPIYKTIRKVFKFLNLVLPILLHFLKFKNLWDWFEN